MAAHTSAFNRTSHAAIKRCHEEKKRHACQHRKLHAVRIWRTTVLLDRSRTDSKLRSQQKASPVELRTSDGRKNCLMSVTCKFCNKIFILVKNPTKESNQEASREFSLAMQMSTKLTRSGSLRNQKYMFRESLNFLKTMNPKMNTKIFSLKILEKKILQLLEKQTQSQQEIK